MAKKLAFDKVLFTTICVLTVLGLAMVYSASSALAHENIYGFNGFFIKQTGAAALGFLAMFIVMHIDYRRFEKRAVVYGGALAVIALLVIVLFLPELNSTKRWIFVGGVSIQPSELAKLALIPLVAYAIDRYWESDRDERVLVPAAAMVLISAILVLEEPDLGTAVLLVASVLLVLFLAGLRWRYFLAFLVLAIPAGAVLVFAAPYRRQRLFAFLHPQGDPLGAGFQALQSLIAVGSGGVLGRGPGQSVQKLFFLPQPNSDFIYSILAEELGLIGAVGVVVLFCVFLWRG
ncbi:MAG TPA: FtsW/RodA/SpoVE family cell cycle protein, partial [Thermoanaerobaculia bacterium]|nr:FtsW/RodA/SpoVE family cell cycle protein [Thermoanaerobaculia bacterium]